MAVIGTHPYLRLVDAAASSDAEWRGLRLVHSRPIEALHPASRLARTLARMEFALSTCGPRTNVPVAFRTGLIAAVPGLRGLAATLAKDAALADAYVHATVLRAWVCRGTFPPRGDLIRWLTDLLRSYVRGHPSHA